MLNKKIKLLKKLFYVFISLGLLTNFKTISREKIILKNYFLGENKKNHLEISSIKWVPIEKESSSNKINWDFKNSDIFSEIVSINNSFSGEISVLNRSIVFDNDVIGPDISWLVPPGFHWNSKYHFDSSIRGHNRRATGKPFWGWNGGDAVGQIYYHPFRKGKYSAGVNIGMRSVYAGSAPGGTSPIGDGLSAGFRIDKQISKTAGVSLGAEQLVHFDGITDTGRDLYLTVSKGWWRNNLDGEFPLNTATFGFATGKMAEGNIKGACSDLFDGSGTEAFNKRRLCWSPVFSLSRVFNTKHSTFFEYNSKWFLLGSSIAPFDNIPLRGTFAVQLSDHVDNYKLNTLEELKWVFRVSLGF